MWRWANPQQKKTACEKVTCEKDSKFGAGRFGKCDNCKNYMTGTECKVSAQENATEGVKEGVCNKESGECVNECDQSGSGPLVPKTACTNFDSHCPKGKDQICTTCGYKIAKKDKTNCVPVPVKQCNDKKNKYEGKLCFIEGNTMGVCQTVQLAEQAPALLDTPGPNVTTTNDSTRNESRRRLVAQNSTCAALPCPTYGAAGQDKEDGTCKECTDYGDGVECGEGGVCHEGKCHARCDEREAENQCTDPMAVCKEASTANICAKCADGEQPHVNKLECEAKPILNAVQLMLIVFPVAFLLGIVLGFAIVYIRKAKHNKDSKDDNASA